MAARQTPGRTMSPAQIEAMKAREKEVMDLRVTGMSFHAINKKLGIGDAYNIFKRAIARDDNLELRRREAIRLEEARLDAAQEGIWSRVLQGEPRAIEVAMKVMERRSKLLGLDFADMISGKLVEVEQAKVMLMAQAMAETMKSLGAPPEKQREAQLVFLQKVRELGEAKYAHASNVVDSEVIEG